MSGVSLWTRFRAAMTTFRDPEQVALPLPEPDIGLAPHLRAMPMYEHWHPGGRTLFGYLHVTRQGHHVAGFTPYVCPAYGANSLAIQLQTLLGGTDRPAVEVSRWKHSARGTSYWLLARAVAQASTGPIQDNNDVSIYENADGALFVRRPSEFLDGRFEPLNDRAREQAAAVAPEPADRHAEELRDVMRKARLWDALLGAARLRVIGWSDSDPGEYRHFGLEAWTEYPGHDFSADNAQAARVLTDFAEAAARVQEGS